MNKQFIIALPCKPYVKWYMEQTFGTPCDISGDKELSSMVRKALEKKRTADAVKENSRLSETIDILISKETFYRYGYILAHDDVLSFCRTVEYRIKAKMRAYIFTSVSFGIPMTDAIVNFQNDFNFPEEIWNFEAILKDVKRAGIPAHQKEIRTTILRKINILNLPNLSQKRTNSALT